MFAGGFRMRFDAMHAVTGPYAKEILENRLGAPEGTARNFKPLPDFGGHHPDPNLVHAKHLYDEMMGPDAPDFGAASDGDGDRNLIIGKGIFVTPSDSLAHACRQCPSGARLQRGSERHRPLDADQRRRRPRRRRSSASACTRRRPAGNSSATCSMPGMATICGEESAGTGSNHVREKDGLWAVLLWLNILAVRGESVQATSSPNTGRPTAATTIRATTMRRSRPTAPTR